MLTLKLNNDRTMEVAIAKSWELSGFFTAKCEFLCGECGRHNRKRKALRDSSGIAWSPCDYCSAKNVFRSGIKKNGNSTLVTIDY